MATNDYGYFVTASCAVPLLQVLRYSRESCMSTLAAVLFQVYFIHFRATVTTRCKDHQSAHTDLKTRVQQLHSEHAVGGCYPTRRTGTWLHLFCAGQSIHCPGYLVP